MGLKEDVLALAEELDGVSIKDDCDARLASGTSLCRGDLECAESAHKACAKRLREIVERDECEVTTMSAYDLLSEEDRKAIAWVREHGGLDMAASRFESGEIAADMLWGKGHGRFWTADEFEEEISKRLMPKGMEWPTVDGEPVVIGERMRSCGIEDCKVVGIDPANARLFLAFNDIEKGKAVYFPDLAKDCHRPAPKALDADGVEIRVGDRLYDTDTGCGRTVRAVNDNGTVEFDGHENRGWFGCFLTHRAPVLAADGMPLREGEHVYHVETGAELVVKELPKPGEYQAVVVFAPPASHPTSFDPNLLTHRAPVLAADGEPLEVGQTVYATHYDYVRCTVLAIEWAVDGWLVEIENEGGCKFRQTPDCFTHQRPVLDADGVPIREGDTVFCRVCGGPLPVTKIDSDGTVWTGGNHAHAGDDLIHEQDTWERIEEDAKLWPGEYAQGHPGWAEHDGRLSEFMVLDLVRRCRALAERGER